MILILLLSSLITLAQEPSKWTLAKGIVDRHEFYLDGEEIKRPVDAWQTLFALVFLDSNFRQLKDCVFYRVPGDEPGKLKIKSVDLKKDCSEFALDTGDLEVDEVSALRFIIKEDSAVISFKKDGSEKKWEARISSKWQKPIPKLLQSSADFKSPRAIYLSSASTAKTDIHPLKDGELCHDISSDCLEKSLSLCSDCEHGWTELPNGCDIAPKRCGKGDCGGKDQPACRRGMIWQRKDSDFDCRTDASFAWCSRGFHISCDGDKAFCR